LISTLTCRLHNYHAHLLLITTSKHLLLGESVNLCSRTGAIKGSDFILKEYDVTFCFSRKNIFKKEVHPPPTITTNYTVQTSQYVVVK
jgi:hypothetical protein